MNKQPSMKQQIRFGAFETNSSSTHSLTTGTGKLVAQPFDKDVLREGVVRAHPGDYGWEYYRYFTAREKLDYLVSQQLQGHRVCTDLDPEAGTAELLEERPRLAMLAKVVKDYTGCRLEITNGAACIDHESVGVGGEVFKSEKVLKQFLFDETAYVQTGNDNSPAPFIISTDKGPQMTYADRVCENAPSSYVPVRLRLLSEHPFPDGFGTETGALVKDGDELFKRLCSKAVVVSARMVASDTYSDYHEGRDAGGRLAGRIFGKKDRFPGLRVLPSFGVSYSHKKVESFAERREVVHLDVLVPPKLIKELRALPPGGVLNTELRQARLMKKHWDERYKTALAEGKTDSSLRWEKGMLTGYTQLVNTLSAEARKLKREHAKASAPASKSAPKKAPAAKSVKK